MPFVFEERLQETIAAGPSLLDRPGCAGPRLLLGREIAVRGELREAARPYVDTGAEEPGRIDVCFAEADGTPTIVEVKLARNRTMGEVLDQALGYAETVLSSPGTAMAAMRRAFGDLTARFPGSPGMSRTVETTLLGLDADALLARVEAHLRAGRCRVVIAGDALPPDLVAAAFERRARLSAIRLDLVNLRRDRSNRVRSEFIDDFEDYRRCYRRPAEPDFAWELVPRRAVAAALFMQRVNLVKDRFHRTQHEFRVSRIGVLPTVLHYEAAPGHAPSSLYLHQVERSRREGCAPVMPNLERLRRTGNPYPGQTDRTVLTDDRYVPVVPICHATWKLLQERSALELTLDKDRLLQRVIARRAGVDLDCLRDEVRLVALGAVYDTLRDCALFGNVRHLRCRHVKHRFEVGEPPAELVAFRD